MTLVLPHVFRGRALSAVTLDRQPLAGEYLAPRTLEGRQQVLLSASYAAGQRRRWRITWGQPW